MFKKPYSLIKTKSISFLARFSSRFWNRFVFGFLALLGILLFFVLFSYIDIANVFKVLDSLSIRQGVAVGGFIFLTLFISAMRWKMLLLGFGYKKDLYTLIKISFKAAAISLVMPSFEISGETFKALELKKKNVSVPASFASVFFDYFIVMVVNIVLGALLVLFVVSRGFLKGIWVAGFSVLVLSGLFLFLRRFFKKGWFSSFIIKCLPVDEKTIEDVKLFDYGISFFIKESRRFFVFGVALGVIGFWWEVTQVALVLSFLGVELTPLAVSLFYTGIYFFNSVPVLGGIGFGETGAFAAGAMLGVPDPVSVSVVLALRVRQILSLVIGGMFFIFDEIRDLDRREK